MNAPTFNPEALARHKVTINLDQLYRWAHVLAGASGAIQGVNASFEKRLGGKVDALTEEERIIDEIRAEMNAKMKEGMGL